jgi:hypothetical protein
LPRCNLQRCGITEIVALHVADGDGQYFVRASIQKGVSTFSTYLYGLANVFEADVAHQSAGKQADSAEI